MQCTCAPALFPRPAAFQAKSRICLPSFWSQARPTKRSAAMSSDGCQKPAWTGSPFSYLMHQPASGTSSYRGIVLQAIATPRFALMKHRLKARWQQQLDMLVHSTTRRVVSCQLLDMMNTNVLECHLCPTAYSGKPCQCPIRTVVVTCCRCALHPFRGEGAISWRWHGRSGDAGKLAGSLLKFLRTSDCKLCSHPNPAGPQPLVGGRRY